MFGRQTISSLRAAADRVNNVGYDASQTIAQLDLIRPEVEETLAAWKTAGQAITIAAVAVAIALVVGIGISAYRELWQP